MHEYSRKNKYSMPHGLVLHIKQGIRNTSGAFAGDRRVTIPIWNDYASNACITRRSGDRSEQGPPSQRYYSFSPLLYHGTVTLTYLEILLTAL